MVNKLNTRCTRVGNTLNEIINFDLKSYPFFVYQVTCTVTQPGRQDFSKGGHIYVVYIYNIL